MPLMAAGLVISIVREQFKPVKTAHVSENE